MTGPASATGFGTPLRVAARVALPWPPADLSTFGDAELAAAADVLGAHGVSFMGLRRVHGDALLDTPLAATVEREERRYRERRDEYEHIRDLLAADGVDSMVLGWAGLHPPLCDVGGRLDLLVPDGGSAAARRRLEDLGYVELLNFEERKKRLFARFVGDGSSLAVRLHEAVGWGVPFLDNDALWNGARRCPDDPGVLVPGARETLLVTVARWLYGRRELGLGDLLTTAGALRDFAAGLGEASALAAARGWEEGFWAACAVFDTAWERTYGERFLGAPRRDEVDGALRRFRFARKELVARARYGGHAPAVLASWPARLAYGRKLGRDPGRATARRARDAVEAALWTLRRRLRVRSQRPLLVSVSGCDGSGKTVQVERLRDVFEACDIRGRVVWARGASSRFMSAAIRAGKALAGRGAIEAEPVGEEARYERRRSQVRGRSRRQAFAFLYALDLVWPYVIKPRLLMLAGNAVLCDRYVYDALVDYTLYSGDSIESLPAPLRALARMAPEPHVGVLLDVEPGEALRRKPEEGGTAHIAQARASLSYLARENGLDVMPADLSAVEVQGRLALASLQAFYSSYGTLVNRLLRSNPSQLNPRTGVR